MLASIATKASSSEPRNVPRGRLSVPAIVTFDIQAKATTDLKNHLATIGMMFPWQSCSFKQECYDFLVIISTFYLILLFYCIGSD